MRRRSCRGWWLTALVAATVGAGCVGDATSEVAGRGTSPIDEVRWAVVHGVGLGLNLREGPSMEHAILAVMPEGTRIRIDGAAVGDYVPVTWVERAGWAYAPYLEPADPPTPLESAVNGAVVAATARSPGSELAVAVQVLGDDRSASFSGDVAHVSASAAKPIWVAAALAGGVEVADLEQDAALIFPSSDNVAAGRVIDRLGARLGGGGTEGADAVNAFMWSLGMSDSAFQSWSGFPVGVVRHATNAPHPSLAGIGFWDNYFTAHDVLRFLVAIDRDGTLGPEQTEAWRRWMTWTPRSGSGGWLGTLLPDDVQQAMLHKGGWLPPPWYPTYGTLTEIGVVQVPDGPRYAVAILARQRSGAEAIDWGRQGNAVELVSCQIYEHLAGADLGCGPAPAPAPTPVDEDDGTVVVYCTDPGLGCGGHWPCWPASDCPSGTACDWANESWGACR